MRGRVEQDRCCEAVLRLIETRLGSNRTNVSFPERERRSTKEVEVCATIGDIKVAIEHTLIEPMEQFIESGHHFENFIIGFGEHVAGRTPAGHAFQLLIPVTALNGIKNKEIEATRKILAAFAVEGMETLVKAQEELPDPRSRKRTPIAITTTPKGIPFCVTLGIIRIPRPSQRGTLRIVRSIEGNIQPERVRRVGRALSDKKEKLSRCRENGYCTVLILENNDIALTSDDAVFEALSASLSSQDIAVDDIFLADTCTTTYAFRHLLIDGNKNDQWDADWDEFEARDLDGLGSDIAKTTGGV
ncbi:MAG: hypothetical protein HQ511_10145 [Rhodospirillales bacterium]|nr:hypothetical protein [Rhodospirillales bacterium]